jgi:hypothetical protein
MLSSPQEYVSRAKLLLLSLQSKGCERGEEVPRVEHSQAHAGDGDHPRVG